MVGALDGPWQCLESERQAQASLPVSLVLWGDPRQVAGRVPETLASVCGAEWGQGGGYEQ